MQPSYLTRLVRLIFETAYGHAPDGSFPTYYKGLIYFVFLTFGWSERKPGKNPCLILQETELLLNPETTNLIGLSLKNHETVSMIFFAGFLFD